MNEADVFLQALQGGDSNSGDPFMMFGYGCGQNSDVGKLPQSFDNTDSLSPKGRRSSIPFEPVSLTPESHHSFYEDPTSSAGLSFQLQQQQRQQRQKRQQQQMQLQQQQQQQGFSGNSMFHINEIEQSQKQPQGGEFVLGSASSGHVKSEYSPRISTTGTDDSKSNSNGSFDCDVDIDGDGDADADGDGDGDADGEAESDGLVKDEFGFNLEKIPSTDEFSRITMKSGKVIKKRKEKTSHNVIEKKYRTNINDKIFQLREIVPTLRVAYKRYAGIPVVAKDSVDLDGLQPARKLNKASILMKTIEYIKHLETKCDSYMNENNALRSNIPTPQSSRSQSLPQQQQRPQRQPQQQNSIPVAESSTLGARFGQFSSPVYTTVPAVSNSGHTGSTVSAATTVSSTNDFQSGSELDPQSVEEDDDNGDFTSKLLMGCFGVSMGLQAFSGDNGEMGSARALFAMPVFHFSPKTGFVVSNSNGVVNLQSSIFALLELMLVLVTFLHLLRWLFFSKSRKYSGKDNNSDIISTAPYRDVVAFDTDRQLKETLKNTLFVNRLKYKYNSMERIESKIAKCFALTLYFKDSKFPWNYLSAKYVEYKWKEIRDQVVKANQRSQGALSSGLEWEMITNVSTSEMNLTLKNEKLLTYLSHTHHEYELKEFLSLINSFILNDTKESLLRDFLDQVSTSKPKKDDNDASQFATKFYNDHIAENELLQSMPEEYEVINSLIKPNRELCDKLLKLVRISADEQSSEKSLEEQLVLYSSVMRYFIANKKFSQCTTWLESRPMYQLNQLDSNELSLVSFTALFLMAHDIMEELAFFKGEISVLESLWKELRIWLGRDSGNVLGFEVRSRLIDYCIDHALVCGSLANEDMMNDGVLA